MSEKLKPSSNNGLETAMQKKIKELENPWAWADDIIKRIDSLDGNISEEVKIRLKDRFIDLFLSLTEETPSPIVENLSPSKKPKKGNDNDKEARRQQGLDQLPEKDKRRYHLQSDKWRSYRRASEKGGASAWAEHRHRKRQS